MRVNYNLKFGQLLYNANQTQKWEKLCDLKLQLHIKFSFYFHGVHSNGKKRQLIEEKPVTETHPGINEKSLD